jgi:hypothetical protein
LQLNGTDKDSFVLLTNLPTSFTSFNECISQLKLAKEQLWKQGYIAASIDSIQWKDSSAVAFVFLGKKYEWLSINTSYIPSSLLHYMKWDDKRWKNKVIHVAELYPYFDRLIKHLEDTGFPFAALRLDSIIDTNGKLSAQLLLDKGPLTKIDSVIIDTGASISKNYLMRYLGLKQGMLYNESHIRSISKRIQEVPFLREAYPWRIYFDRTKTSLHIYPKNKSANRADVLLGLMPNNSEIGGRLLLTGDVKFAFQNALGYGESLMLNWQNLQYKSPRYDLQVMLPYIFNSPVGISVQFDYYKKDTTFRNINGEVGLIHALNTSDQFKLYYRLSSNRAVR